MKKIRYQEADEWRYVKYDPVKNTESYVQKLDLVKRMGKKLELPLATRRAFFGCKVEVLQAGGCEQIDPRDFIRDLYPADWLQSGTLVRGEKDGKGCGLITTRVHRVSRKTGESRKVELRYVVKDDYANVQQALDDSNSSTLIFPLLFFGNRHRGKNAHQTVAICIDIDYVWVQHLTNILHQCRQGVMLPPTYIASSGNGVHLWYLLDQPLNMYPTVTKELKKLKRYLINYLWNDYTSARGDIKDSTNIYQGFRMPGVYTKLAYEEDGSLLMYDKLNDQCADDLRVSVWRVPGGRRYNLRELYDQGQTQEHNEKRREYFLREWGDDALPDMDILETGRPKSKMTLEQARELYPEWYERKILDKKEDIKKEWEWRKGANPGLYEWWKGLIDYKAKVGGRYFALRALAQFGRKCHIPPEVVEKDILDKVARMDSLSLSDDAASRFTADDAFDAMNAYYTDKAHLSTYKYIQETSQIREPKKTKRRDPDKRLKQPEHLKIARMIQEQTCPDWRQGNGRKPLREVVQEWRREHPDGTKAACIRKTGLSKPTVYKWWKGENEK